MCGDAVGILLETVLGLDGFYFHTVGNDVKDLNETDLGFHGCVADLCIRGLREC